MSYIAQPLARAEIRALAKQIREFLGLGDQLYFPALEMLELIMPQMYEGFSYEIVPKDEMPENRYADTDVVNRIVRIREDIYEKAVAGDGFSRMTVVHEIAHFVLIVICGVKFARSTQKQCKLVTYRDPEWQAKALAGELMCPQHLICNLSVEEIMLECGVSEPAARYNLMISRKE